MVVTLRTSQPSLSISTETMALKGDFQVSISFDCLRSSLQLFLALAGRRLGNLAVLLGVDDQHGALQFGANLLQVCAHLVAVAGVVHHHEQDGLLAERLVLGVALAPFLDAQLQVVGVLLGEERAFVLRAAWRGWPHRAAPDA